MSANLNIFSAGTCVPAVLAGQFAMGLSESTLEKIAQHELELVLSRTDKDLLLLIEGIEEFSHVHEGVEVNFQVMMQKGAAKNQYRVSLFAFDDGPAREEFPVMAAAEIEFE